MFTALKKGSSKSGRAPGTGPRGGRGQGPSQPWASSLARQLARSLLMVAVDRLPGSEKIFWNRDGIRLRNRFSTSHPPR